MNIDSSLFQSFRRCILHYCPVLGNMLQEPHKREELELLLDKLGIQNLTYRDLYLLTNGIDNDGKYPTSAYDFCDFGVIPTIEFVSKLLKVDALKGIWTNSRFPVITSFAGDYLLLETANPNLGKLLLYSPNLGYVTDLPTYYDSIDSMFRTIISCFEIGAYRYDTNTMTLITDIALKFEISRQYNPFSSYWNS